MANEERLVKKIKLVYTEITQKLVDRNFKFPNGGKSDRAITSFLSQLKKNYGEVTASRLVDYCVFQVHKNRNAEYLKTLAVNSFGPTAFKKYIEMSSKGKTHYEDQWLSGGGLTRASLQLLIGERKSEHPLSKYIFMPAEESTKRRCLNTETGQLICELSTLMWSPFSAACSECTAAEQCRIATEKKYPEIFRIRIEEYGKGE